MTAPIVTEVLQAANEVAPDAPVVEVAEAVVNTASDPSPSNILADIELVLNLVKDLQGVLANSHSSVVQIAKTLLKKVF